MKKYIFLYKIDWFVYNNGMYIIKVIGFCDIDRQCLLRGTN